MMSEPVLYSSYSLCVCVCVSCQRVCQAALAWAVRSSASVNMELLVIMLVEDVCVQQDGEELSVTKVRSSFTQIQLQ